MPAAAAVHVRATRTAGANRRPRVQSLDIDFTADIAFDEQGIVLDYPGIARLAA